MSKIDEYRRLKADKLAVASWLNGTLRTKVSAPSHLMFTLLADPILSEQAMYYVSRAIMAMEADVRVRALDIMDQDIASAKSKCTGELEAERVKLKTLEAELA